MECTAQSLPEPRPDMTSLLQDLTSHYTYVFHDLRDPRSVLHSSTSQDTQTCEILESGTLFLENTADADPAPIHQIMNVRTESDDQTGQAAPAWSRLV